MTATLVIIGAFALVGLAVVIPLVVFFLGWWDSVSASAWYDRFLNRCFDAGRRMGGTP